MNLAAGVLLLSVVLLGMMLLCCAHADDTQMAKVQRKIASIHPDRPAVTKANTVLKKQKSLVARPEETAKFDLIAVPVPVEKQQGGMNIPEASPELSIQLKGVRG